MTAIDDAAARLRQARSTATPCAPVRELLPDASVEDAYAVQQRNTELAIEAGARRIGWKIGLTNPVVQQQFGVFQPDFGPLFAHEAVGDGLPAPAEQILQARVEAEVAFVLDGDLDQSLVTAVDVLRATAFVLPAIEIVDSRVAGWDISIIDTVADNASSGLHVVGPSPRRMIDVDLHAVTMRMSTSSGEVVSTGSGAGCLAHPVNAVVWLANTLAQLGQPLRAGDLILSGALGPMVPVVPGEIYEAVLEGLGTVRASFRD